MLITTASQWFVFCWGCFCFCKGNQFYANHNSAASLKQLLCVVFAFAKVINFMLITTLSAGSWLSEGCFCFCKGNQFYANHNRRDRINSRAHVVFAFAKVINFMLITTNNKVITTLVCCFCFCKGNQFYANHNEWDAAKDDHTVVFAFAKVINFMLITTGDLHVRDGASCFCFCKGNQFYANHNPLPNVNCSYQLFLLLQR